MFISIGAYPRARARLLASAASLCCVASVCAAEDGVQSAQDNSAPASTLTTPAPESVYVWGLRENTIGQSQSSSEGVVNFALFADRPLLRPGVTKPMLRRTAQPTAPSSPL